MPTLSGQTKRISTARDVLRSAIRNEAILRAEHQRLIARSGANNSWLIDLRRISLQGVFLNAIADLFWEMCECKMPFQVGGVEVGAVPLVSSILMKSVERGTPVNGFIMRKERKTYGTGSLIEGKVTQEPIIIVDDICNTGQSLEKIRIVLAELSRSIDWVFVLIDYHSKKGKEWRERHTIPIVAPFMLADFDLACHTSREKSPTATFQNTWSFAAPDPNFYHRVPKSFPTTDGKSVYFGSDCGVFWCVNAQDGSVLWNFRVTTDGHKNLWSAPVLHQGRVFFGSYDGNVYCLNAETGDEMWRFTGADWVGSSPALAIDLGLLFIGLEFAVPGKQGSIAALNIETGEKVWEHLTRGYVHGSPAYWPDRQVVACGSNDNEMLLFDGRTGATHWRFETKSKNAGSAAIRHAPAFDVKRGHLITGCANGDIYVIDVATGNEIWSVHTHNTVYTVPLVVDDTAYVGSTDKYFYILDLEQQKVKDTIDIGSKIFGPARLLNGRIYFGACSGLIYEIDPESCCITGRHQLPDAITNALTFSSKTQLFYALTYVNELFAFRRLD